MGQGERNALTPNEKMIAARKTEKTELVKSDDLRTGSDTPFLLSKGLLALICVFFIYTVCVCVCTHMFFYNILYFDFFFYV